MILDAPQGQPPPPPGLPPGYTPPPPTGLPAPTLPTSMLVALAWLLLVLGSSGSSKLTPLAAATSSGVSVPRAMIAFSALTVTNSGPRWWKRLGERTLLEKAHCTHLA